MQQSITSSILQTLSAICNTKPLCVVPARDSFHIFRNMQFPPPECTPHRATKVARDNPARLYEDLTQIARSNCSPDRPQACVARIYLSLGSPRGNMILAASYMQSALYSTSPVSHLPHPTKDRVCILFPPRGQVLYKKQVFLGRFRSERKRRCEWVRSYPVNPPGYIQGT